MGESLVALVRGLCAALVDFQPESISGEECGVLVDELASVEKVCAAARVRAAARAGACGAHKDRGFADVSDWMARASGSTAASAKAALETTAALDSHPEVKAALEAGELSLAQARELVRTEAECPGSAADLLDVARQHSLKTLKEQARDRRVRAVDPEELHRVQHSAMHARHWRNRLGNVVIAAELPPELGVPLVNRLDAETDRLWDKHRREANRQRRAARGALFEEASEAGAVQRRSRLAAQALAAMFETGGTGKAQQADLVIVCDLSAYRRGYAEDGERCHIIGGGPIPAALAQELGRDAFLKAVLHDGTDIRTIAHFGRRYPAVLRTALTLGAPPDFDGSACSEPGCDRRYHLERDHINPCANGGRTSLENLEWRCWPHHRNKTDRDRSAGLLGRNDPVGHCAGLSETPDREVRGPIRRE